MKPDNLSSEGKTAWDVAKKLDDVVQELEANGVDKVRIKFGNSCANACRNLHSQYDQFRDGSRGRAVNFVQLCLLILPCCVAYDAQVKGISF